MGNEKKLLMNAVEPHCFAENMTPSKHEGLPAVGELDRIATPPCSRIARGIPGGGRVTHRTGQGTIYSRSCPCDHSRKL